MEYILAESHLPISSNPKSMQYLIWQHKQNKENQRKELEKLKKFWTLVEEEEEMLKDKKKEPSQRINAIGVYERNIKWKESVDCKLSQAREQKLIQIAEKEMAMQENQVKPLLQSSSSASGPITSWESRFHTYLLSKHPVPQSPTFTPAINKKSRRLVSGMVRRPIEDRLIEYGEQIKARRDELEGQWVKQIRGGASKERSISSQTSEVFWRLYKQGQKNNRAKETIKSKDQNCSFMPTINEHSAQILSKVSHKRKPLYYPKIPLTAQSTNHPAPPINPQKSKAFLHFLQRNQTLLAKININRSKKQQQTAEKQIKQINQCTFKPKINSNSIKIIEEREQQSIRFMGQTMRDRKIRELKERGNLNDDQRKYAEVQAEAEGEMQAEGVDQQIRQEQWQQIAAIPQNRLNLNFSSSQLDKQPLITTERERRLNLSIPHHSSITLKSPRMLDQSERQPQMSFSQSELPEIKQVDRFQEDSIERMRDREWREELSQVEKRVIEMMKRTQE